MIFTTAFHEHAVQAFEVNAIDYLVKPVRVQRLLSALQKVPRLKPVAADKLAQLLDVGAPVPVGDRALARRAGADRETSSTSRPSSSTSRSAPREREYLLEESLTRLENEFGARFVRVHRNCLVAREHVRGFERRVGNDGDAHWEVLLHGVAGDAAGVAAPAVRRPRHRPRIDQRLPLPEKRQRRELVSAE